MHAHVRGTLYCCMNGVCVHNGGHWCVGISILGVEVCVLTDLWTIPHNITCWVNAPHHKFLFPFAVLLYVHVTMKYCTLCIHLTNAKMN